jgi:hypothetical protein
MEVSPHEIYLLHLNKQKILLLILISSYRRKKDQDIAILLIEDLIFVCPSSSVRQGGGSSATRSGANAIYSRGRRPPGQPENRIKVALRQNSWLKLPEGLASNSENATTENGKLQEEGLMSSDAHVRHASTSW